MINKVYEHALRVILNDQTINFEILFQNKNTLSEPSQKYSDLTQLTFTCSKSTTVTVVKVVKYIEINQ